MPWITPREAIQVHLTAEPCFSSTRASSPPSVLSFSSSHQLLSMTVSRYLDSPLRNVKAPSLPAGRQWNITAAHRLYVLVLTTSLHSPSSSSSQEASRPRLTYCHWLLKGTTPTGLEPPGSFSPFSCSSNPSSNCTIS